MVSLRHLVTQAPVLAALGRVALSAARGGSATARPSLPGPWTEQELAPRPDALIAAYLRHLGADPAWYRGTVPAHLFPQWGFPLAAQGMVGLPYPLTRVVNAGCRLVVNAPLPSGRPLRVRARLAGIDDDGRRAILTTEIVTGTAEAPDALVAELRALVPLANRRGEAGAKERARPTVPADAREIAYLRLRADAGLDFALLTGDFNPIHWVPAYARAAGFRACILHGFSTMARAAVALDRAVYAGRPRLRELDVRFTRPLVLPGAVGVYVRDGGLFVGDAPGGGAYLEGKFTSAEERR